MRRLAMSGSAMALMLLVPSLPAAAAATPTVAAVLNGTCADGLLGAGSVAAAKGSDGTTRGFATFTYSATCGDTIFSFTGSGASWTSAATTLRGKVVDVAADQTGTYLLYIRRNGRLTVAKRSTAGVISRLAELASTTAAQDGRGSIVAGGGTWYAVWPQYTAGRYVLQQAGTMSGGGAVPTPTTPAADDTHPALTLGADGQPRLFWQRAVPGGQDLLLTAAADGAWQPAKRVAAAVPISDQYPALDVAATDRRTYTSWTTTAGGIDTAIVGTSAGGAVSTSIPPADPYYATYDAHLQASASTVFAALGAADAPPGRALTGVKNGSADWSMTGIPAAVPGSIDSFGVAALIYLGGGRTTTLLYSGNQLYAVTTA